MKNTVRLTEADLVKLVKRILSEDEDESMMGNYPDESWHQMRRREVPIAQVDLSRILSIAQKWCRGKDNLPDCQRTNELYMKHYL